MIVLLLLLSSMEAVGVVGSGRAVIVELVATVVDSTTLLYTAMAAAGVRVVGRE